MFEHSYHATHTTSGNQKPREDDSFELGDIDDDTDMNSSMFDFDV